MNVGGLCFTVISYATMLYERGRVPLWLWELTAWILLAAVAVYFAVRLGARWSIEGPRRRGSCSSVIPQANPFSFVLYAEESVRPGTVRLRFDRYHLLRGKAAGGAVEGLTAEAPPRPVRTAAEAVAASYAPSLEKSWILAGHESVRAGAVRGGRVRGVLVFARNDVLGAFARRPRSRRLGHGRRFRSVGLANCRSLCLGRLSRAEPPELGPGSAGCLWRERARERGPTAVGFEPFGKTPHDIEPSDGGPVRLSSDAHPRRV
jgi:hypothetical protein